MMATPTLDDISCQGLVLEGGDVIIRTSEHASGIFVVHKDVLVKHSPVLAAILPPRWNKPRSVPKNASGESLEIYELDLYFDRETKLCLVTGDVWLPLPITANNADQSIERFNPTRRSYIYREDDSRPSR